MCGNQQRCVDATLPAVAIYSELTKTSTALARLAVLLVLATARRLGRIFVNTQKMQPENGFSGSLSHPIRYNPARIAAGQTVAAPLGGEESPGCTEQDAG